MSALAPRRPLPRRGSLDAHGLGFALAIALVAITPNFQLFPSDWELYFYNEKRLWQVSLLCLYGLLLILSRAARNSWSECWMQLPPLTRGGLVLVTGIGLASAASAERQGVAALELGVMVLLVLLTIGVAAVYQRYGVTVARMLVWGLAGMAAAYEMGILAAMAASAAQTHVLLKHTYLFDGFANIRFLNQVQSWTLPLLALPVFVPGRSRGVQAMILLVLGLWWALLLATSGRGSLVAFCTAAVSVLVLFGRYSLPWLKAQAMGFSVGLLGYWSFSFHPSFHAHDLANRLNHLFESESRLQLLEKAWQLATEMPFLGAGPGHYGFYPGTNSLHPHNSLAQLAAEWGVAGTVAVVSLCLWGLISWVRQSRLVVAAKPDSQEVGYRIALTAALLAALAHSLVSGLIVMPLSQLLAALVVGLILGSYLKANCGTSSERGPSPHLAPARDIAVVTSIAALVLLVGSMTAITLLEAKDTLRLMREFPGETLYPRFWLPGNWTL